MGYYVHFDYGSKANEFLITIGFHSILRSQKHVAHLLKMARFLKLQWGEFFSIFLQKLLWSLGLFSNGDCGRGYRCEHAFFDKSVIEWGIYTFWKKWRRKLKKIIKASWNIWGVLFVGNDHKHFEIIFLDFEVFLQPVCSLYSFFIFRSLIQEFESLSSLFKDDVFVKGAVSKISSNLSDIKNFFGVRKFSWDAFFSAFIYNC